VAAADGDGGIVVNLAIVSCFAVAAGGLLATGCAYVSPNELAARGGQAITSATVEQITADPYGWSGKWVSFEGVLVFSEIESKVYATEAAAREGWVYDQEAVGIEMSEASQNIPSSPDGKRVRVVGQVDASCNAAHKAAEQASNDGRIVWASGFCHTSIGPHLDHASVRSVRSPL